MVSSTNPGLIPLALPPRARLLPTACAAAAAAAAATACAAGLPPSSLPSEHGGRNTNEDETEEDEDQDDGARGRRTVRRVQDADDVRSADDVQARSVQHRTKQQRLVDAASPASELVWYATQIHQHNNDGGGGARR